MKAKMEKGGKFQVILPRSYDQYFFPSHSPMSHFGNRNTLSLGNHSMRLKWESPLLVHLLERVERKTCPRPDMSGDGLMP